MLCVIVYSTRTWKYEDGYLSSDESTTDPEDLDMDDIDASMGGGSVSG